MKNTSNAWRKERNIKKTNFSIVSIEKEDTGDLLLGIIDGLTKELLIPIEYDTIVVDCDLIWLSSVLLNSDFVCDLQLNIVYQNNENEAVCDVASNYIVVALKHQLERYLTVTKLLDAKGNIVIPAKEQEIKILSKNYINITNSENVSVVVDKNNKQIMPAKEGVYEAFNQGLFIFSQYGAKHQIIDKNNSVLFEIEDVVSENENKLHKLTFDKIKIPSSDKISKLVISVAQVIGELSIFHVDLKGNRINFN